MMTTKIFFSSNSLGSIAAGQIQSMLDRFHLGELISSERTAEGVMKQTMFIASTAGEYVLKGNPVYEGQWVEEKFFVEGLHEISGVPVPIPYIIDEQNDIFGWSYALMPRLPGMHFNNPEIQTALSDADQMRIASCLAETLNQFHLWKAERFGEYDPVHRCIRPFMDNYGNWLYGTIKFWLDDAQKYSVIRAEDQRWVDHVLKESEHFFRSLSNPTFVMGDFKPENVLMERCANDWRVSGVIDFTTSYFGDGIADLSKIALHYLDLGQEDLAKRFISDYMNLTNASTPEIHRLKVHLLHQRVLDWGCAYATDSVTWNKRFSFAEWADRFVQFASDMN
ncbi:phosphotransferase [Paenibacillus sp. VCA1]|uniref:phosphotransferase family protein n=1 Tax=Paenibacillus sp. VCA1 TaxID=3039148 RepID=UPI0028724C17|nr:phosphotransferase [Paenibacillus sp. VCA1]MDR9855382.1 phosphotransferase [Paenibacillus sp. VCA1]